MPTAHMTRDALEQELGRIASMTAAELRQLWQVRRGSAAPASATARLMRAALAWDLQADALGGESASVRRSWEKIETARAAGASAEAAAGDMRIARLATEGTRLIKHWRGRTHEVLVERDGVAWRGGHYRSLSAVARAITGSSRNGPAFFGLREAGDSQ